MVGQSECNSCAAGYYYSFEPFVSSLCNSDSYTLTYGCQLGYDEKNVENVICSYSNQYSTHTILDYYPQVNMTARSIAFGGSSDYVNNYGLARDYYSVYLKDAHSNNYNYYSPWISTSSYYTYNRDSFYGYRFSIYDKPSCCKPCQVGKHTSDINSCSDCEAGKYGDNSALGSCKQCPRYDH